MEGYYYKEGGYMNPLEVAYWREHDLRNYAGRDYYYEDDSKEVQEIFKIIEMLE